MFLFLITFSDKSPKFVFISKLISVITASLLVYYLFETGILHIFLILDLILISYLIKQNTIQKVQIKMKIVICGNSFGHYIIQKGIN